LDVNLIRTVCAGEYMLHVIQHYIGRIIVLN